jgi:hypothetical protein
MDFIVGLPRTQKGNDSIWVIVNRLTKVAHFLPVKTNYSMSRLAELYVDNILKLHGAPRSIVSDRGPQFNAQFWKSLHASMGTKLNYSTTFHPQTDGQTERVNQVLEDLLRACVLTYGSDWEKSLSYAEFSYNNGYQDSLKMAPFEALYSRKCRTPLMWSEVGERTFFSPATIVEAEENVAKVRENLKIAQSRQKSYADPKRREVSVGAEYCPDTNQYKAPRSIPQWSMLSNKRHRIYPSSGRGGRTSSSGVLKALYCSAPGVPVVGMLQARRERKPGFQVPGVVTKGVVGGLESKCVAQLVSCCVVCLSPSLSPAARGFALLL